MDEAEDHDVDRRTRRHPSRSQASAHRRADLAGDTVVDGSTADLTHAQRGDRRTRAVATRRDEEEQQPQV